MMNVEFIVFDAEAEACDMAEFDGTSVTVNLTFTKNRKKYERKI